MYALNLPALRAVPLYFDGYRSLRSLGSIFDERSESLAHFCKGGGERSERGI